MAPSDLRLPVIPCRLIIPVRVRDDQDLGLAPPRHSPKHEKMGNTFALPSPHKSCASQFPGLDELLNRTMVVARHSDFDRVPLRRKKVRGVSHPPKRRRDQSVDKLSLHEQSVESPSPEATTMENESLLESIEPQQGQGKPQFSSLPSLEGTKSRKESVAESGLPKIGLSQSKSVPVLGDRKKARVGRARTVNLKSMEEFNLDGQSEGSPSHEPTKALDESPVPSSDDRKPAPHSYSRAKTLTKLQRSKTMPAKDWELQHGWKDLMDGDKSAVENEAQDSHRDESPKGKAAHIELDDQFRHPRPHADTDCEPVDRQETGKTDFSPKHVRTKRHTLCPEDLKGVAALAQMGRFNSATADQLPQLPPAPRKAPKKDKSKPVRQLVRKATGIFDWWTLSKQLIVPVEVLRQAGEQFQTLASLPEGREPEDNELLREGRILRAVIIPSDPEKRNSFAEGDDYMEFEEFALWFWARGFEEHVIVNDPATQRIREIARERGLTYEAIEKYKRAFDMFDEDGSGDMGYEEFAKLVPHMMKLPKGTSMPEARLKDLWKYADIDGSGELDFEEFVEFYQTYFDPSGECRCPFEEFYRRVGRPRVG